MKFEEFCDLCNLTLTVSRVPNLEGLWIAGFKSNDKFQGAGGDPGEAIRSLAGSLYKVPFTEFRGLELLGLPKFSHNGYSYED